MTSSSILGTSRLAVRSQAPRLPITPPIVPRVPVAPVVPVGPAPATGTPAPVAPPIAPGEMELLIPRFCRPAISVGDVGDRLANGGEPFGNATRVGGQRVGAFRMLGSSARHRRAEQ